LICAHCKAELDPALRLCSHCGAEIAPAGEPEWRAQIRETVKRRREEQQRRLARPKEDSRQLSIFSPSSAPSPSVSSSSGEESQARERRAAIRARVEEKTAKLAQRGRRTRPLVDAGDLAIGGRGGGALAAAAELSADPLELGEEPAELAEPSCPGGPRGEGPFDIGSFTLATSAEPASDSSKEPENLELALPGERLLAALVDLGFITTLLLGLTYLTTNIVGQPLRSLPGSSLSALGLLGFFLGVGYLVFFWGFSGQTLGGLLTRVRVIAPSGGTPGMGRAAVRVFGCALAVLLLGVGFIGWWTDRERRGWPDRLASTHVVRG